MSQKRKPFFGHLQFSISCHLLQHKSWSRGFCKFRQYFSYSRYWFPSVIRFIFDDRSILSVYFHINNLCDDKHIDWNKPIEQRVWFVKFLSCAYKQIYSNTHTHTQTHSNLYIVRTAVTTKTETGEQPSSQVHVHRHSCSFVSSLFWMLCMCVACSCLRCIEMNHLAFMKQVMPMEFQQECLQAESVRPNLVQSKQILKFKYIELMKNVSAVSLHLFHFPATFVSEINAISTWP